MARLGERGVGRLGVRGSASAAAIAIAVLAAAPRQASASPEGCPRAGGSAAVAWGRNALAGGGQLGASAWGSTETAPVSVVGLTNVSELAAGLQFSLALLGDCMVVSWGANDKGQLGDGERPLPRAHPGPVRLPAGSAVEEIGVVGDVAVALLSNGTVWTWGASEFGTRGNGESGFYTEGGVKTATAMLPRDVPAKVALPEEAPERPIQIAVGRRRVYALLEDGHVMAWGENAQDELGLGAAGISGPEKCEGEGANKTMSTPSFLYCSTMPLPVLSATGRPLSHVAAIAAGGESAYALLDDRRTLYSWGANEKGQLGIGPLAVPFSTFAVEVQRCAPVAVPCEPEPVTELSAAGAHVLALLADGGVESWGANGSGELGRSTGTEVCGTVRCGRAPAAASALSTTLGVVERVQAGVGSNSFAVGDGALYAFGSNGPWGALGIGSFSEAGVPPTRVEGVGSVSGLAAGADHNLAILSSGAGPSRLALTAGRQSLIVHWSSYHSKLLTYSIKWRPWSEAHSAEWVKPMVSETLDCGAARPPCELAITSYNGERLHASTPYEVYVGVTEAGRLITRRSVGTPEA